MESLQDVAGTGQYLRTLEALRDRVAAFIDITDSARDLAALSQRLLDVTAAIEAVRKAQPDQKGTPLDELARRRADRESPAGAGGAEIANQPRT